MRIYKMKFLLTIKYTTYIFTLMSMISCQQLPNKECLDKSQKLSELQSSCSKKGWGFAFFQGKCKELLKGNENKNCSNASGKPELKDDKVSCELQIKISNKSSPSSYITANIELATAQLKEGNFDKKGVKIKIKRTDAVEKLGSICTEHEEHEKNLSLDISYSLNIDKTIKNIKTKYTPDHLSKQEKRVIENSIKQYLLESVHLIK